MTALALVCPRCHGVLRSGANGLACLGCSATYAVAQTLPIVIAGRDGRAAEQAAWFDDSVDAEYEISRPHGTPPFHRWLLAEKFRRSTRGLDLRGCTVLSVCAGSGMDAEFLARAGATVIAADISPGAARRAGERARRFGLAVTPIVADVEQLPFADASVDVVYVHDGLHHLEDPVIGLREMARVARRAVCVSEPADAQLTRAAVRIGVALEREEAGNRVARLTESEVCGVLSRAGFRVAHAERYGMFYRHEPGLPSRVLSTPGVFQLTKAVIRLANLVGGRLGNKLAIVAVRS